MRRLMVLFSVAAVIVCVAAAVQADNVVIPLDSDFDLVGDQVEVIQGFLREDESLQNMELVSFGIYDTGASVVTLSYNDQAIFQAYFGAGVPIKPGCIAEADGVDGKVYGNVSQPITVVSEGLHALNFNIDPLNPQDFLGIVWDNPAVVSGIQVFVGNETSTSLPTISGTPMHYSRTPGHPDGCAAYINKQGYVLDLRDWFPELFQGEPAPIPYSMSDLQFKNSDFRLQPPAPPPSGEESPIKGPIRVPLDMLGGDNYSNPGDEVTYTDNPFVTNVGLTMEIDGVPQSVEGKTFLFDTGAMISVMSTAMESALELTPDMVRFEIDVSGAAGAAIKLRGYSLSMLELPYQNFDEDGSLTSSEWLQFKDVPIFVLDVGEDIDGILGMNLFNQATEMLYNPYDSNGPSLELIFDTTERELIEYDFANSSTYQLIQSLLELYPLEEFPEFYSALSQIDQIYSSFFMNPTSIPGIAPVPEPGTFVLLAFGASVFLLRRIVRRRSA